MVIRREEGETGAASRYYEWKAARDVAVHKIKGKMVAGTAVASLVLPSRKRGGYNREDGEEEKGRRTHCHSRHTTLQSHVGRSRLLSGQTWGGKQEGGELKHMCDGEPLGIWPLTSG